MKKIVLKSFIFVLIISILSILFYFVCPKFKNVTISINENLVSVEDFVTFSLYKNKSKILNEKIKYGKVGSQSISLSFNQKNYNVKLNIIDDIKPDVKYKNVTVFAGEEVNAIDFIDEVFDHSNYDITIDKSNINYNNIGTYNTIVTVKDEYGNVSSKECILDIKLFNDVIYHELGKEFLETEIYFEDNKVEITDLNIAELNVNKIGEYNITFKINDNLYSSKVIVDDNEGPVIVPKQVTIYTNEDYSLTLDDLIENISDNSKYVFSTSHNLQEFDLGKNIVPIIAMDSHYNVSKQEAVVILKNDNVGPVITGAKDITIHKGDESALLKKLESNDKTDGVCGITYNKDDIDINVVGKYKLVYYSCDKSTNCTSKAVKLTVIPSQEEVDKLFNAFYDKYLKGKDILEMTKVIRTKIKYKNVRGVDAIYTGLSTMSGSCYVHAAMLSKALDMSGVENHLVVSTGKYHTWVLAYDGKKWRHYDPTPGKHPVGPLTDSERYYAEGLGKLIWDDSLPRAK